MGSVEVGVAVMIIGSVEAFVTILTVRIIDFGILHGWIAPGIEELEERARVALGESSSV